MHPGGRRGWHARTLFAAAALTIASIASATSALAQYSLPTTHPRVFLTSATIASIADRCKVGGSHRPFYDTMKSFSDARIASGGYLTSYIPNYALVYKIHRHWNQTGYQGGGFEENKYWQAARTGILSGGAWAQNEVGAEAAITADWIWEKLTPAEIAQIASYYGSPVTSVFDSQTWRAGHAFGVLTQVLRSTIFVGAGVNDVGYAAEYQAIMSYLITTWAPAYQLSGGVGPSGPGYDMDTQFFRSWAFEAMKSASGVDPWPLCQKWASEFGNWEVYARVSQHTMVDYQQDILGFVWGDHPRNSTLLALRGRSPGGQYAANSYWSVIQSRTADNYANAQLWCLVLWYDPTLAPHNPATAPLAVRLGAGGMDEVYMRSSWTDPSFTSAEFEAGKYFYGHQHMDAGSFTISRKGYLALDSGVGAQYHGSNGEDFGRNYYRRSIAHNTISVYDAAEIFFRDGVVLNDGGQHVPPSDPTYQDILTKAEFSTGTLLRYDNTSSYTYCQGDIAPAYNSARIMQRYNLGSYTNKITSYTREFVYLRPDFFVCFDRVSAKSPTLSKVWNLHVSGDPQISGASGTQVAGNATGGIWEYPGADVMKVTDPTGAFQRGSMYMKSLLPKQRMMRKIGGNVRSLTGYAFWAGGIGANGRYDPKLGANHYWGDWLPGYAFDEDYLWAMPVGWGRVEVQPTVDATTDLFLHVMYPCDEAITSMPDTRLVESANAVGAEIVNRRVLMFGRTETSNLDSLTYTLAPNDTAAIHTIADLTPGASYRVYKSGTTYSVRKSTLPAPPGATEIVSPPPTATTGGVVEFGSVGGSFLITVTNVTVEYQPSSLSVTIRWQTSLPSDSQIEFGTTTSYGQLSSVVPPLVTSHAVTLTSPAIANDVTYQFRAVSRAPGGFAGYSGNGQFKVDVVAPNKVNNLLVR